jgi:hypothetical protein
MSKEIKEDRGMLNRHVYEYLKRTGLFEEDVIMDAILAGGRDGLIIRNGKEISLKELFKKMNYPAIPNIENIWHAIRAGCCSIYKKNGLTNSDPLKNEVIYKLLGIVSEEMLMDSSHQMSNIRDFDVVFLKDIFISWDFFRYIYKAEQARDHLLGATQPQSEAKKEKTISLLDPALIESVKSLTHDLFLREMHDLKKAASMF